VDQLPPITDELSSVLAFHGQHAFALGSAIALAERSRRWLAGPDLGKRWPSRLVATAQNHRCSVSDGRAAKLVIAKATLRPM